MHSWLFPKTLQAVWTALPINRREEIANLCSKKGLRRNLPFTLHFISKRLHFREHILANLPDEKLSPQIIAVAGMDRRLADEVFRTYFLDKHKKMMARFLDHLGIEHTDSRIEAQDTVHSRAELERAVAALLREFPSEDVALYTQVLNCQNDRFWAEMVYIDFSEIEIVCRADDIERSVPPPIMRTGPIEVVSPVSPEATITEKVISEEEGPVRFFSAKFEDVKSLFECTADQLRSAADEVLKGVPPSPFVNESVDNTRLTFQNFCSEIIERSGELGIQLLQRTFDSLDQIAPVVTSIEAAERAIADSRSATRTLAPIC